MNKIEIRNGRFYLLPENKEISKSSVLAIKQQIRECKRILKRLEEEVEANKEMCAYLREKADQGTITANESLGVQNKLLAKSIGHRNNVKKELDELEFSLEIAIDLGKEKENEKTPQSIKDATGNEQLSHSQIAIIYAYKNETITKHNCDEVAVKHGYTAKNSGEAIYQKFNRYYIATNRRGDEGSQRKNKNKIDRIESIIKLLPPALQDKAKDEVEILKNIQNTEY